MYDLFMEFLGLVGFGVIVYDLGTSMSGYSSIDYPPANDLGNWKIVYANSLAQKIYVQYGLHCEINDAISQSEMVEAVYGHYYAFAYYAASMSGVLTGIPAVGAHGIPNYITGSATLEVSTVTARIG